MITTWLLGAVVFAMIANELRTRSRRPAPPAVPRPVPDEEQDARRLSEWRTTCEGSVHSSCWIPSEAAGRIVERHPPPGSGSRSRSAGALAEDETQRLRREFDKRNVAFLAKQKLRLMGFFDAIECDPLTEEQRDACIRMDGAVLVVAAAGSGKTSTMVAKAAYVIHVGLARPEQVLLLSFNKAAAAELRERVGVRLAGVAGVDDIVAETFNKIGLRIIAEVAGRKPALAKWVGSPEREVAMVADIAHRLGQRDPRFRSDWDLFRTVHARDLGSPEAQGTAGGTRKARLRTASGHEVASGEELLIANWLFFHHADYRHESPYEHDTATKDHRQYRPDFFYPSIALYHEHFGLDEHGRPPPHFAPDYLEGVAWKRALHAEKRTDLFETTSHGLRSGRDLPRLKAELERRGVELRHDPSRIGEGPGPLRDSDLAALVRAFQQHAKGNRLGHAELRARALALPGGADAARAMRFVDLYARIADEWERRLREEEVIDFDDMIVEATRHVEEGRYKSPFTVILADEFQDSSHSRLALLKALRQAAGDDGHLCVVGDDWQAINRFAGADVAAMTDFHAIFPDSSRLALTRTFRCPQAICDASSAFVQANPRQIRKQVATTNPRTAASLVATAYHTTRDASKGLARTLARMHRQAAAGALERPADRRITVMLLSRFNSDLPPDMSRWQADFGDLLEIGFRTVHRSKGLEADYVFLLDVVEGVLGFPGEMAEDPVLQLAMPAPDPFPMSEERRLFYVALTRARRQVRIQTIESKPSRFLLELARAGHVRIAIDGGGVLAPCPECEDGVLRRREGRHGLFDHCSVACGFTRRVTEADAEGPSPPRKISLKDPIAAGTDCPVCGQGEMVVRRGTDATPFVGCSRYPRCKTAAPLRASA